MGAEKKIKSALISVFDKSNLEPIINKLDALNVTIYSTGGTQSFIEELGVNVIPVESLTSYPSILGGRVKTLHPKVFGGILSRRELDSDVADGPFSIILNQVENGVAVRMAVLYLLANEQG